jgi:glyceraldehyde-3-phosphate dehydrogenase/erythrose-4-phosphate dehydrogenase
MRVPKIAINGFGRIGRIVTRIAKTRRHISMWSRLMISPPRNT